LIKKSGKRIYVVRRPMHIWKPGTNILRLIIRVYGVLLKPNDFIVISDKALAAAYGYLYDESKLRANIIDKALTYLVARFFWGRVFNGPFSSAIICTLRYTPLEVLASHKKLALIVGGLKHFFKPVSEAGIDTSNLPKSYVSLPVKEIGKIVHEIREELTRRLHFNINILILDTDKTFQLKNIDNIAFSTRPSSVRGIIDLGGVAYFLGKKFRGCFREYPTPVAYSGIWIGLKKILHLSKIVEKYRGYGAGRDLIEMMWRLKVKSCDEITWSKISRFKHYPVLVVRIGGFN